MCVQWKQTTTLQSRQIYSIFGFIEDIEFPNADVFMDILLPLWGTSVQ